MNSKKNNKYGLSFGIAGSLGIILFYFFNHASYSTSIVIDSILLIITMIFLVIAICSSFFGQKKLKSKWILVGTICMFLCSLVAFLGNYFKYNNIKVGKNIIILIAPIVLIAFFQVVTKYKISTLKDEKIIKKLKRSLIVDTFILIVVELVIIYGVFILHR